MIDGLTILNSTEVMVDPTWLAPVLLILILATVFGLTLTFNVNNIAIGVISAIVAICSLITFIIIGAIKPEVPTGRYQHEVILEDDVSLIEIYEQYEVIEQRGDIWVLEDKEKE